MIDFEYFLNKGDVKKQSKNEKLAKLLIKESFDRLNFIKSLSLNKENAKYFLENIYDILRELIEAKLALEGFKSYSHEATILFLKKFPKIKESEIRYLDNLRKIRHGIKYYGRNIGLEEAERSLDMMDVLIPKLESLAKE